MKLGLESCISLVMLCPEFTLNVDMFVCFILFMLVFCFGIGFHLLAVGLISLITASIILINNDAQMKLKRTVERTRPDEQ